MHCFMEIRFSALSDVSPSPERSCSCPLDHWQHTVLARQWLILQQMIATICCEVFESQISSFVISYCLLPLNTVITFQRLIADVIFCPRLCWICHIASEWVRYQRKDWHPTCKKLAPVETLKVFRGLEKLQKIIGRSRTCAWLSSPSLPLPVSPSVSHVV